ncbi:unnamed protein product [Sphagnum balticum]
MRAAGSSYGLKMDTLVKPALAAASYLQEPYFATAGVILTCYISVLSHNQWRLDAFTEVGFGGRNARQTLGARFYAA